jgi:hypothetical protein
VRLPSLAALGARARATAARFPLALLSGVAATIGAMAAIEARDHEWELRLLGAGALGLPLFTAIGTTAERLRIAPRVRRLLSAVLAATLILLFVASLEWTDRLAAIRYFQLLLGAHLVVAVLPWLGERSLVGFWQYNRILFLQYLLAAFYVAVLWVGLAIALAAIDRLLGIDVPGELYPHLFVLLAFVFHPWFFLSFVPSDFAALDTLDEYPAGLKVFTQFVLIPLVTVYLLILTAYLGRVLVTRIWPSGWIGWLVSSVSVTGVLALLLVHPIRERADSRWVNAYGRWFFVAILPSLGMLLVAIGKRVGQYGFTEPRYFLLVLALWLLGLSLWYAVTASRNIKLVPLSLCVVTLLAVAGPWGAYAVSRSSQIDRLERILSRHGLEPGPASRDTVRSVPFDDRREVSAILSYLRTGHGNEAVARAVGVPADSVLAWAADSTPIGEDPLERGAMRHLGLAYLSRWARASNQRPIGMQVADQAPIDVSGFDLMIPLSLGRRTLIALSPGDSLTLRSGPDLRSLAIQWRDRTTTFDLGPLQREILAAMDAGADWRQLDSAFVANARLDGMAFRLVLVHVMGDMRDSTLSLTGATGWILIRRASPPSTAGARPTRPE